MKIISIKKSKGFTLIEMLVVVLIIGILAGIALPQYNKAVERSRAAEPQIILKDMFRAQQGCLIKTGDIFQCVSDRFWSNASFEPPTELVNDCSDLSPCFKTTHWEYYVDDFLYALRVRNNEVVADLSIGYYTDGYIRANIICANWTEEDYCKKIGVETL